MVPSGHSSSPDSTLTLGYSSNSSPPQPGAPVSVVVPLVVVSTAPVLATAVLLPSAPVELAVVPVELAVVPVELAVVPVVLPVPVPVLVVVGGASPVGASPLEGASPVGSPVAALLSAGDGPHATMRRNGSQRIRIRRT